MLLSALTDSVLKAGGWILARRPLTETSIELQLEFQAHRITEIYGHLIASGLELTRTSHRCLTELCLCQHHLPRSPGTIASLVVTIQFLQTSGKAHVWPVTQSRLPGEN